MPSFSPIQGHVPAAVPFLGHALEGMNTGKMRRVMFVAEGSLFLGRISQRVIRCFIIEREWIYVIRTDGSVEQGTVPSE